MIPRLLIRTARARRWPGRGWFGGCFCAGALLLGTAALAGEAKAVLDAPMVLTQVPVSARPRAGGFAGARIVLVSPEGQVKILSAKFQSACDPDISHDGQRMLFAGKQDAPGPWGIWELDLAGGEARAITKESRDCRTPIYLGSLFTLDSPQPWFTVLYAATETWSLAPGIEWVSSLYSVKLDGTEPRRLTFNPTRSFDPVQMWDGRVIYAVARSPQAGAGARSSLFDIHIDGMDHELFGAEQGKRFQRMPCSLGNGRVVFVESDQPTTDGAGQLASVREQRPHHSYEPLTEDRHFVWLYPSALTEQAILVSRRAADGQGASAVYCFDTSTRRAELVFESPEYDAVQAKIARRHPVPDGRSTVVDTKYNTGKLYGLNCYTADPGLEPPLRTGMVQRVRLLEAVPEAGQAAASAGGVPRRLLGEAPVEADGSFHIEIPADTPVQLQAMDSNGLALATCDWIWVKQKENLGCIGCHEDPESIPENLFVSALARAATHLTLPAKVRRSVGFREHVLPVLRNKCATTDCHGGPETPLALALGSEQDAAKTYAALLERKGNASFIVPGRARASFLAWQVLGRDVSGVPRPATDTRKIHPMPPPGKAAPLTPDELRALLEWIDFGAQWETPTAPAGAAAGKSPK